jgi:hypothetical protein
VSATSYLILLGFSNETHLNGTYEGSYTWFMAAVIAPNGVDRTMRRIIQYNVHASIQYKTHVIRLGSDSEDVAVREWVGSIRGGDTIQIIPKAQWPVWINFVREAEIEAHGILDSPRSGIPIVSDAIGSAGKMEGGCYRSLDESTQEIRLIALRPGSFDEPISCSLVLTTLQEPRVSTYEALSYCWGDPRQRSSITITVAGPGGLSEYDLSVNSSLETALKNIRPTSGAARVLWIDAICINQTDFVERSSQVSLMRQIYSCASRVVVWLGEGSEMMSKSIELINIIGDRYETLNWSKPIDFDDEVFHDPLATYHDRHLFVLDWTLFELPWFHRTWVVQEIFNAKTALFCCGSKTVSWATLLRVQRCIALAGAALHTARKTLMPPIYEDLFDLGKGTTSELSADVGILEVLVKGLDLDVTDPRDKIFAMLQFGKETRNFQLLPPEIVPDYHKSAGDVFSSFTKWWIIEHQSLRILSAVQALEGRTWQETSWERNKRHAEEFSTWSWGYRGQSQWAIGLLGLQANCLYRASADKTLDIDLIKMCNTPSMLPLKGVVVDVIEKIAPYPYYLPQTGCEALHRAYIGIFDPLNHSGKWQYQQKPKAMGTYMTDDDPGLVREHISVHYDHARRTGAVKCHSDCFFSTQRGLVGLCPYSSKPGDTIVILYGGSVPYVLRKHKSDGGGERGLEDKYEFVGECFVQGHMHGEAIREKHEEDASLEMFLLV